MSPGLPDAVALKPFPDLSRHRLIFDDEEKVIELWSAPSNHMAQPDTCVGVNIGVVVPKLGTVNG